jgi:hypothetical protein
MTSSTNEQDKTVEQPTIARFMIATIAFTALVMAFGITLIAHGGAALAQIAL